MCHPTVFCTKSNPRKEMLLTRLIFFFTNHLISKTKRQIMKYKMTSKNPHESALDEFQRLSKFETRHALHIRVRSHCKEKKIGLKHLSKAYRGIVEQSLRELLDVTSLTSAQYTIIDNFCAQVPSFYSKKAKSLEDVCRLHEGRT